MSEYAPEPDHNRQDWYFCLRHHTVEKGRQCPAIDRLGPYASRDEAEHAFLLADERNAQWDEGIDRERRPEGD